MVRQQPRPASLMAKIRASVSNFTCHIIQYILDYMTLAAKKSFLFFLFIFHTKIRFLLIIQIRIYHYRFFIL